MTSFCKKYGFILLAFLFITACDKPDSEKGMDYFKKKEYDKAIELFDAYLVSHPKDANTYFNKGRALEEQGKLEDALENYQKAAELEPDEANFWLAAGMANFKMQKYDAAISNMEGLLKLQERNGAAKVLLARSYAQVQKIRSAMETLNEAISEDDRNGEAYYYRGYIRAIAKDINACNDLERAKGLGVKRAAKTIAKYCEGVMDIK